MMITLEDYLLFMFSMKGVGKRVDMKHILEKVRRDMKIEDKGVVKENVEKLIKEGLMEEVNGLFGITSKGKEVFSKKVKKLEKDLEKVNRAWLIVYKAKQYYPVVADTVFDFCKDRYVGFYALFTEKRFFRRDFRGKKIVLRNINDLLYFVNIHCIDVIPCVHRIGVERPDWLVVDIDPGPKIDFETTKQIAQKVHDVMEKLGLHPVLKFSGSRGFQVWSWIEDFPLPEDYTPLPLKSRKREKNYFTLFSDFVRIIQKIVAEEFPNLTTSDVGSKKEREDKVLLDPSSMKRMGLVRAPYSVHSKTGLVSVPLSVKELKRFELEDAKMERVTERYKKKGNEFILKLSNPKKILEMLI